ncbi:hypothetical protein BH18ACI4_BH18ACI4_01410 [soil metagenome]
MKSNMRLLLLAAAISLVTFSGWSVQGQKTPGPKVVWEHAVVSSTGDSSARLSQLGTEGWELAAVRSEEKFTGNFRQMEVTYYLKRAKPTAE